MDIDVIPTALSGVVIIRTDYFRDERGYFIESYHKQRYAEHGLDYEFVQDNHSRSGERVLRGIHYQDMTAPMAAVEKPSLVPRTPSRVDCRPAPSMSTPIPSSSGQAVAMALRGMAGVNYLVSGGGARKYSAAGRDGLR